MTCISTRPIRTVRVSLGSAVLLTLLSLANTPALAIHLSAGRAGIAPRSVARPAGPTQTLGLDAGGPDATWSRQAAITATDGTFGDSFGLSVALDGNTALVGAGGDRNSAGDINVGAAYVFVRSGTTWSQQQEITASDGTVYDDFGYAVALSGDTALVAANGKNNNTGAVYVFVRHGTTWSQQAKLTASDGAQSDGFGQSVALSGDTALIGAPYPPKGNEVGAAYVFVRSGTTWSQQAKLIASDHMVVNQFGWSVALSGSTALIGAPEKGNYEGAAYIFVGSGTTWRQQAEISAPDGAPQDDFGHAVSLSGDTALVGADGKDRLTGAAYAFVRCGATWMLQQELTARDSAKGTAFGQAVALSGNTALIGSPYTGNSYGAAYVFERGATAGLDRRSPQPSWSQQAEFSDPAPVATFDYFGRAVGVSGDTALVGSLGHNTATGAAYVYVRHDTA